jgi:hypothetical protein
MPRGRGVVKLLFLLPGALLLLQAAWGVLLIAIGAAWGVLLIAIGLLVVWILTYHVVRFGKALVAMICVAVAARLYLVAPNLWPFSLILGAAPICYVLRGVVATRREGRVVSR